MSVETLALAPSDSPQTSNCASVPGYRSSNARNGSQTGSLAEATPNRICTGPAYFCRSQLCRHWMVLSSKPLSGLSRVIGGVKDLSEIRLCKGKRYAASHCQSVSNNDNAAKHPNPKSMALFLN